MPWGVPTSLGCFLSSTNVATCVFVQSLRRTRVAELGVHDRSEHEILDSTIKLSISLKVFQVITPISHRNIASAQSVGSMQDSLLSSPKET
jgi:hypothetical protein